MMILIRGAGDLASGVAVRLYHSGLSVVMTELAQPLAVRRLASFAEVVYAGEMTIEGISARCILDIEDTLRILQVLAKGRIPVLVDPEGKSAQLLHPSVIVDARMLKKPPEALRHTAKLYIGLGPGFTAPDNCHAAIETQRGHWLGRVIWQGSPRSDSGLPESVEGQVAQRVLRAPISGTLSVHAEIGERVSKGQLLADVDGQPVLSPFDGVLRGILHTNLKVQAGLKIGDVDPRNDPSICSLVSDKALAVGGGVLEAILARSELRQHL